MLYAKVVLGLPVEGPFDYIVTASFNKKIKEGVRVRVPFRNQKKIGYVVKLSHQSRIKNLKEILELIDESPILDKEMLALTKDLSEYYCCSWGEAIETALPQDLRKGKKVFSLEPPGDSLSKGGREVLLMHDLEGNFRWDIYLEQIKETINSGKSAIILLPNIPAVLNAKKIIESGLRSSLGILYRNEPKELEEWVRIRQEQVKVIVGTRSSIFAPVSDLGLVIIDEEEDSVYKQDQVPHYHAREVGFMRADIEKAKLILGSNSPSLESFYLAKTNKIKYSLLPRKRSFPEIKVIDMKLQRHIAKTRGVILSKYLVDAINLALNSGGKILLFLNRKGFATSAYCHNCGLSLRCPRCNINLVYHFSGNLLSCHYCNFKMEPPKICPQCNSGYIKYSGTGTEKVESELSRIFPTAKIKRIDTPEHLDIQEADIFVATSAVIKHHGYNFDLIGTLGIDNSLNRVDFRSSEKAFNLLSGLLGLTDKKFIIQTSVPGHYCFQALVKNDINLFYEEELKHRKHLKFPPYKHMALVKLRGKIEERVKKAALVLFEKLSSCNKDRDIRIISPNPGHHAKLRGNFYWQVLISSNSTKKVSKFLKLNLKDFRHSGIIVTVDIDPL